MFLQSTGLIAECSFCVKGSMFQSCLEAKIRKNKIDHFCFEFDKDIVEVNLNDISGQQHLKNVFSKLLKLINDKDVELKLEIEDGYKKVI